MTASELAAQLNARKHASGWLARCPAHEDRTPSLSIAAGDDGRVLLKCHAGCTFTEVAAALGLKTGDLFADSGTTRINRQTPRPTPPQQLPTPTHDSGWWAATLGNLTDDAWCPDSLRCLAGELGISALALQDLGFLPTHSGDSYAIRMCNAAGMCGIQFRGANGRKWLLTGSICGLFIPLTYREGPLIVCEGASDTAAMLSLGFDTIGRFNAGQNPQFLVDWLAPQDRRDVVLVVDADPAGERGAQVVAKALRYVTNSVRMVTPGRWADAREWVRRVPAPLIRSAIMAARRL